MFPNHYFFILINKLLVLLIFLNQKCIRDYITILLKFIISRRPAGQCVGSSNASHVLACQGTWKCWRITETLLFIPCSVCNKLLSTVGSLKKHRQVRPVDCTDRRTVQYRHNMYIYLLFIIQHTGRYRYLFLSLN